MKKYIFQSAVGAIILLLSDRLYTNNLIYGVNFTTENNDKVFVVKFNHKDRSFVIKIQNEKTDKMLIFVNGNEVGDCINIEKALEEVKSKLK